MTASVPRSADSWTLDDLYHLPNDGNRYELIEGRLLVSPAPDRAHFRAATRLHRLLLRAAPEHLAVGQNAGLVDGPKKRQLAVMLLRTDRPQYRDAATVRAGETWQTDTPFPIELDPAAF